MAVREGLSFETEIMSDLAPLGGAVQSLLTEGIDVRCLRDLTRGGLASALHELAEAAAVELAIEEARLPVLEPVARNTAAAMAIAALSTFPATPEDLLLFCPLLQNRHSKLIMFFCGPSEKPRR